VQEIYIRNLYQLSAHVNEAANNIVHLLNVEPV